jgi:thioester reductase-like protein
MSTKTPPGNTPESPARSVLLTGFPTFTARYLLAKVIESEPNTVVRCVVRAKHMKEAAAIVEGHRAGARVQLLEGDICSLDLGLSGREYLDVVNETTDVYHLAAIWHTAATAKELRNVNVVGTQNVLQCVRDIKNLNRYNHVSTAYVCGNRTGVIMEEEFDEGQTFRNPYEETQFQAERRVRQLLREVPITIYRPSLIVGDSKTGQIDDLTGPYYLMKPLVHLPVGVPLPRLGAGEVPLNLVPVDYVVSALHRLSLHPEAVGRTFHLVDRDPLAARRVLELVALAAGKPLPRGRVPVSLATLLMKMPLLEQFMRPGRSLLEDFNRWCIFNAINTAELTANGPHCPSFPDYVGPLVDYLKTS